MTNREPILRRIGPAFLTGVFIFALTFAVVLRFRNVVSDYTADYMAHALWSLGMTPQSMLRSFYDGSEHLWHLCVRLVYGLNGNLWAAAAFVTAAANGAAGFLLCRLLDRFRPERTPRWLMAALVFVIFTAHALMLPGQTLYISSGSINTWHNPTNLMVRPFALAVFYMTVNLYDRRRAGGDFRFEGGFLRQFRQPVYTRAELVLYPLCILFSAYAKPSFLQFFAPAIFLFLLIDVIRTKGMLLPFCLKLALAYLPAGFIILMQFTSFFSGGVSAASGADTADAAASSAGIMIYFLQTSFAGTGDLLAAVGGVLLRILRLSAFPLFLLAIAPRDFFRSTSCRLGFFGAAVGRLESVFLHETGSRAAHGNMLWGQYLSAWLLWCAVLPRFVTLVREKTTAGKLARFVGIPLLLWHFASGVVYLTEIFLTGEYFI